MNILYDLKTLDVQCVIYDVSTPTDKWHDTLPNVVRHPVKIPLKEIQLTPHPTIAGQVVVSQKIAMGAVLASPQVKLGQSVLIDKVPTGATITSNGETLGVMDSSQQLEFTPGTAGFYVLKLTMVGYLNQELNVEAVA